MNMIRFLWFLSICGLAGCGSGKIIETTRFDNTSEDELTIPYYLPRGLVPITIVFPEKKPPIVSSSETQVVPDDRVAYQMRLSKSAFRSDDYKIVLSNGLLTSVDSSAIDQTPAFTQKLLSGVSDIVSDPGAGVEREDDQKQETFQFLLDPFNHKTTLVPDTKGRTVKVKFRNLADDHVTHSKFYNNCPTGSLCFPLLTTVKATVEVVSPDGSEEREIIAIVPDPRRVAAVDVNSYACGATTSRASFSNGILTGYNVAKGSEAVDCLSIPLDIIRTIIAVPFDAITGRTARVNANQKLVAAQAELLNSQTTLINNQRALIDAQQGEDD